MAKKVIKYEDTTGRLHDTLYAAQVADREVLLKEQLFDIAQSINCYNMSSDDLAKELFEYRTSIRSALTGMDLTEMPQQDLESEYCILKTELKRRNVL